MVDPSHGTGHRRPGRPMALAAAAVGADGLHHRGPSPIRRAPRLGWRPVALVPGVRRPDGRPAAAGVPARVRSDRCHRPAPPSGDVVALRETIDSLDHRLAALLQERAAAGGRRPAGPWQWHARPRRRREHELLVRAAAGDGVHDGRGDVGGLRLDPARVALRAAAPRIGGALVMSSSMAARVAACASLALLMGGWRPMTAASRHVGAGTTRLLSGLARLRVLPSLFTHAARYLAVKRVREPGSGAARGDPRAVGQVDRASGVDGCGHRRRRVAGANPRRRRRHREHAALPGDARNRRSARLRQLGYDHAAVGRRSWPGTASPRCSMATARCGDGRWSASQRRCEPWAPT